MTRKILRLPEVQELTSLSSTTIYRRISEGTFPRQIRLGANTVGWFDTEIDAWLEECASSGVKSEGEQ